MNKFKFLGLAGLACLISYSAGRFTSPAKVETIEVERVVYKDRVVKDTEKDVTTKTKETTLPDGTKIKETTKEDKSKSKSERESSAASEIIKEMKTENRPNWRVAGIYSPALPNQETTYGLTIERRIVGEVFLGVTASTDKTVGLVLSFGF